MLDTETTTDTFLNLNFGVYQFCEKGPHQGYRCLEEGVFFGDDLALNQIEVIRRYVVETNRARNTGQLKLRSYDRRDFVEKVMYKAIQAGAAIVAFNLPFDLSRSIQC